MPELPYEAAQQVKQYVRDLAADPDVTKGVNAVIDFWEENPGLYEAVHQPDPVTGVTLRNPGPDATAMTEKYLRNTQAATQDWVRGMRTPRRNPKQAAIAASGKWANRVQTAIQNDRYRRGVQSYDEGAALEAAVSDGGSAYAAGIQKRSAKVAAAMQRIAPMLGAVSQAVQQMPQDTEQQREARMLENLRQMRQLGVRLRGGA